MVDVRAVELHCVLMLDNFECLNFLSNSLHVFLSEVKESFPGVLHLGRVRNLINRVDLSKRSVGWETGCETCTYGGVPLSLYTINSP